jgi:hypothetical protein
MTLQVEKVSIEFVSTVNCIQLLAVTFNGNVPLSLGLLLFVVFVKENASFRVHAFRVLKEAATTSQKWTN